MAVMTSQPPIGAQEQKPTTAVASPPAATGAETTAMDKAVVGMDLDTNGSKNESSSAPAASPADEESNTNGDAPRPTLVNGDSKEIAAPPSPPVPTPPLQTSNDDNAQDLSDLHITSPDGSFVPSLDALTAKDENHDTPMEDAPAPQKEESTVPEPEPHENGEKQGEESREEKKTKEEARDDGEPKPVQPEGGQMDDTQLSAEESKPAATNGDGEQAPDKEASPVIKNEEDADKTMMDVPPMKASRDRDEEDENEEDRPSKRAKTEDTGELNVKSEGTSTEEKGKLTGPLTPARAKFVLGVVRSLRRTKDARPFSMPVDAVKLNVPHYYDVIKNPMDLQTMERKLNNDQYTTVDEFVDDFKLILYNCELFNGEGHIVTNLSKVMEAAFYRHMSELPGEDVEDIPKPPKSSKKKGGSSSKSGGGSKSTKTTARPKKEPKSTAQSPAAASPVFSLQPSGVPQIRRDSTAGDGRPKREIHPPAPKDLPYSTKPRRKQNAAELKFCETVLKELYKKVHQDYAFPFYQPVDPVALNIPDYFKIIKRPMDLSTIQEKLKVNAYDNADEFEADIRLMFNNCYKFNPPGQAVHMMGRRLEAVFDDKWKDKPLYTRNQAASRSPVSPSPPPQDEVEMSEDEEDDEAGTIEDLEKKLEAMKEMITTMKQKKKKSPPAQKKKTSSGHVRKASNAAAVSSSKKSASKKKIETPYISLEQKTELSERINFLQPQHMKRALKMIKENMPEVGQDGAEIELDIDELDPATLYRLYQYVAKHAPPVPQTYQPPPPPPQPTTESKAKSRSSMGQKVKKNKPMTAAEQEAKIKELESRLGSFNQAGSVPPITPTPAGGDSDSSEDEDDESSGSESEEE